MPKELTETQRLFHDYRYIKAYVEAHEALVDRLSMSEQLNFYGLYMQIEYGNVRGSQPGLLRVEDRAKWNAWDE